MTLERAFEAAEPSRLRSASLDGQLGFSGRARRARVAQSQECARPAAPPRGPAHPQRDHGGRQHLRHLGARPPGRLAHSAWCCAHLLWQVVVPRSHGVAVFGHARATGVSRLVVLIRPPHSRLRGGGWHGPTRREWPLTETAPGRTTRARGASPLERRGAESNRRMEVLQTSALPLGYRAAGRKLAPPDPILNPTDWPPPPPAPPAPPANA